MDSGTGLPVKIPNGESIPVKGVGETCLENGIKIKHVLNIPDFKCNLISVSRLTKDLGCTLTFFRDFCVKQDSASRNSIGIWTCKDGLYYMEPAGNVRVALGVSVAPKIWHQRLGHVSNGKLQYIGGFGKLLKNKDEPLRLLY